MEEMSILEYDYYMQFSDHKMISITLKAGEKNEDSH